MTELSFLGLALADALNPFSIAAMAYLLTTDRPIARGTVFILGTLAVYVPFGTMLVEGWTAVLAALVPLLPAWAVGTALIVAGLSCVGFALWSWMKPGDGNGAMPLSDRLTLPATAAFAVASTLADAPTAVPYFAAATLAPLLAEGRVGEYLWVVLYCLIYVTPLVLLLALRVWFGDRAERSLGRVRMAVDWSFRYLLPPVLAVVGIWLGLLGLARLI
jgi:cytochrome c biogenesis protein CcdA